MSILAGNSRISHKETSRQQDWAAEVARVLAALSQPTRLRILRLLAVVHSEYSVGELVAALKLPQPTVSRHLSILRLHGLVAPRRDGKFVFYRLSGAVRVTGTAGTGWRDIVIQDGTATERIGIAMPARE